MTSAVKHFREEFEAGYHTPAWELLPYEAGVLFPEEEKVYGDKTSNSAAAQEDQVTLKLTAAL